MKRILSSSLPLAVAALLLLTACQPRVPVGTAFLSLEFGDSVPSFLSCWIYDHDCVQSLAEPQAVDARTSLLTVDSVVGHADVEVWTLLSHVGVRLVPGDTIHLLLTPYDTICYPDTVRSLYPDGDLDHGYYAGTCLNPVADNDIVDAIMNAFSAGDLMRLDILRDAGFSDSLFTQTLPVMEQHFADLRARFGRRLTGNRSLMALADLRRAYMLVNLRDGVAKEQGIDKDEVPGCDWLYDFIQPNSLAHARSSLTGLWLEHEVRKSVPLDHQPLFAYTIMALADSLLTNPAKAQWLDDWIRGGLFGSYAIDYADLPALWERCLQVGADCPEVLERWQKKYDKMMATAPGKPIHDILLQAPDGSERPLSSLFGKLLYIDVWATWCGPCCAEIPYIEKLVEQFRDNDEVAFVSLSVDRTADPWLQKIGADRPAWPQYRLTPEQNKQFSDELDIQFIPRFVMIAPDGTICHANAPRPSAPTTAAYIEECLAKYRTR